MSHRKATIILKNISLYKISYFPEPHTHNKTKIEIELDLYNKI